MDYRMMEKLDPCPYNSSHQILPHRMAMHIIKCKKNYPNADMKVCIFNAVHVVPSQLYQAHLLECESRELVERELYCRPQVVMKAPLPKVESSSVQGEATKCEDWESECVQSSYSPEEHIIYKEFTRPPPPGLSKGARKAWRLKEIDRVNRLKNGMIVGGSQSDTNTSMSEMSSTYVAGGRGAGGAIPKLQDKFKCDVSRHELAMMHGQMSQKGIYPNAAVATPSPKGPSQNDSLGNHINKSQEPKDRVDIPGFIKEKRKLEKKLFEVKKLENMKVNYNQKLTDQEESKILCKEAIEKKLSDLMAVMDI